MKNQKRFKKIFSLVIATFALFVYLLFYESNLQIENEISKSSENTFELAFVNKVIDGDTIQVSINGENFKVRLIGVDAPETSHPSKLVECFGKEATEFTKNKLLNQTIKLKPDITQQNIDQYGRLLRYVYINDELFNLSIIREGYAHEYTFKVPYLFQNEFKKAEKEARESVRGLWGEACKQKTL